MPRSFHNLKMTSLSLLLMGAVTQEILAADHSPSPKRRETMEQRFETLGQNLTAFGQELGIRFQVAPSIAGDQVPISKQPPSEAQIKTRLKTYNWLGIRDGLGQWVTIRVTGRRGDGQDPVTSKDQKKNLLTYRSPPAEQPHRYQHYPKGSFYPITISRKQLENMALGDTIRLSLPSGDYTLRHDDLQQHPNGDTTWVGQLEGQGQRLSRTLITLGAQDQVDGQITTPEGILQVESDASGQWLVDLNAAGFQRGAFEPPGLWPVAPPSGPLLSGAKASTLSSASPSSGPGFESSQGGGTKTSIIDTLLLYSGDLPKDQIETRLNSLMAMTNQALKDSRAPVQLHLVGLQEITGADQGTNRTRLQQLTAGTAPFDKTHNLRERHAADMVLLIRPFDPSHQDFSCGEAWVNGSQASALSPDLSYGVINDGRSQGYFCSNYTLAHEVGHLLGAAHDRLHSNVAGHFSFAYGYGVQGAFGDIMSYYSPEIGLYGNPELDLCLGSPCGIPLGMPQEADVVETFKRTAATVSDFLSPPSSP